MFYLSSSSVTALKRIFSSNFEPQISMPDWLNGDVLDVRAAVMAHTSGRKVGSSGNQSCFHTLSPQRGPFWGTGTLNIPAQLSVLGLAPFLGRQHSGIDVSAPGHSTD
jgi:3'-5' exoribonuclease 1